MKQFLLQFFTWWNGQTLGTRFYTWRKGEAVGMDEFNEGIERVMAGLEKRKRVIHVEHLEINLNGGRRCRSYFGHKFDSSPKIRRVGIVISIQLVREDAFAAVVGAIIKRCVTGERFPGQRLYLDHRNGVAAPMAAEARLGLPSHDLQVPTLGAAAGGCPP